MNTEKQYKTNSIKKLNRNFSLINGMSFFRMFMIIMPIMVPFQSGLGMSMTEILLLQSVFSGVMFLTEIPSGYIADLLGIGAYLKSGTDIAMFYDTEAELIHLGASVSPGQQQTH